MMRIGRRRQLLNSLSSSIRVSNDDELLDARDKKSLKSHSYNYDNILSEYSSHVSKTLKTKRFMKLFFFWLSILVMIFCIVFIVGSVIVIFSESKNNSNFSIEDYIIPSFTALSSFLTIFIVIPKIIAEYLFNSNEDSVMKDIVSSIQEYDKYIRKDLHNTETNENGHTDNNSDGDST